MMQKALFAVFTAIGLALGASAAPAPAATPTQTSELAGVWQGALQLPGQALDFSVTLREGADGDWSGHIDIPAQNLSEFPLSDIAVAAGSVSFAMSGVPGDPLFLGSLDAATGKLSGTLEQSGQSVPFELERTGDAPSREVSGITPEDAARLAGDWSGAIDAGGRSLRIILHLEAGDDGSVSGTMDSPDQGQSDLPISAVGFDGVTVSVELTYAGVLYTGTLSDDGSAIDGSWQQGGGSVPLRLERQ